MGDNSEFMPQEVSGMERRRQTLCEQLKRDNNMFHNFFGQRHPSLTDFLETKT